MDLLFEFISYGPTLIMSILFFIISFIIGIDAKGSLINGLKIGIGFYGISLMTNNISNTLSELVAAYNQHYQLSFELFDIGWPIAANIAFQALIGIFMITFCFILNIVLIHLKCTNTLNIDIWNYWHFVFTASIMYLICGSVVLSISIGILDFLLVNYYSDLSQKNFEEIYGLTYTTFPSSFTVIFYPIIVLMNRLFNWIFKASEDSALQKEVTFDPILLAFMIGFILSIIAQFKLPQAIYFAILFAASILLFPLVTSLLGVDLQSIKERIIERFVTENNLFIGITHIVIIGNHSVMTLFVILIPLIIIISIFFQETFFSYC